MKRYRTHNSSYIHWDKEYFSVTDLKELKKLQKLGLVVFRPDTLTFRYVDEVKQETYAYYKGEIYYYTEIFHSGCFMPYVYKRLALPYEIEDLDIKTLPVIFK